MEIFIFGFVEILFVVYWIFGHNIIWIFGFVTILRLWWWRLLLYWNCIIWIQFCAVISIRSIGTIWNTIYTIGFFGWIIWIVWFLVIYWYVKKGKIIDYGAIPLDLEAAKPENFM